MSCQLLGDGVLYIKPVRIPDVAHVREPGGGVAARIDETVLEDAVEIGYAVVAQLRVAVLGQVETHHVAVSAVNIVPRASSEIVGVGARQTM